MTDISTADWLMANISIVVVATVLTAVALDLVAGVVRRSSENWTAVRTSVTAGISYAVAKGIVSKVLMFGVALWVHDRFALFDLPVTVWWTWLLLFLGRDFVYYWVHRAEHRFAGLWASHMVHHSSEEFTFTTAVRMPWMEALYKPVIYLWAPLLGFHPAAAAVLGGLVLIAGQFHHTELGRRYPLVEKLLVTPSVHRVHHGSNPQYLDKNFGSMLTVWDHLFGTFEPEVEKVEYGLTGDKAVTSVSDALTGGYRDLAGELREAPSIVAGARILAARP